MRRKYERIQDLLPYKFEFNETSFNLLMKKRIHQVLLVCSRYDAFILEEDGRIDEQVFNEYVALNLRYPPVFIQANSFEEAVQILQSDKIDLIITMLNTGGEDPFRISARIKEHAPHIPSIVLTPFSREVSLKLSRNVLQETDYVFSWLGHSDILLAIIKLIEDKMNVDADVNQVGVQTIILVEDSTRFYSSYLPILYKIIFRQSKEFMIEGLNEHQKMLRMRGRPKILLATTFEEAMALYEKYKNNLLGIISDFSYLREGEIDEFAGVQLCIKVKEDDPYLPFLLQSGNINNKKYARELNVKFLYKNAKNLSQQLTEYINEYLAFGAFVFRDPDTMEAVGQARDLQELQNIIYKIPDKSLYYHLERNHFSKWLNARALFPLAEKFKVLGIEDFENLDEIRDFLYDSIAAYRASRGRGIIADFDARKYDEYMFFSRIGSGSLGGKARGLAFVDSLIKQTGLYKKYPGIIITIPRTVVITTEYFDEFMEINNLYKVGLSDLPDEFILENFLHARLPVKVQRDLDALVRVIKGPVAIRSSSLLEDSYYQPFAGVYNTYMLPFYRDKREMIYWISQAIKAVYASVFYRSSRAYMNATHNVIDEEKMAVVVQEVCGNAYGDRFYPVISGVGRSLNYYPIAPEKPEDGIVLMAFGLGKYVVDGGRALRFSPRYPKKILQLSTPKEALKETQKEFYAIDLKQFPPLITVNDSDSLLKLPIEEAERDGTLHFVSSFYDYQNDRLREGKDIHGKKVITFSRYLKYNQLPLAEILDNLLKMGEEAMKTPVEIEFSVNVDRPAPQPAVFSFLQLRPVVNIQKQIDIELEKIPPEECLIISESALGNGIVNHIHDIVMVKPESFDKSRTVKLVPVIEKINESFIQSNKNYILAAPGRWGSSDPWLGIPVKWAQISQARLLIEVGKQDYRVDPSQGTHFFQNLTSFQVGYFTLNPDIKKGVFRFDELGQYKVVYEDEYIKHIQSDMPFTIVIDGRKNKGVVIKPGKTINQLISS